MVLTETLVFVYTGKFTFNKIYINQAYYFTRMTFEPVRTTRVEREKNWYRFHQSNRLRIRRHFCSIVCVFASWSKQPVVEVSVNKRVQHLLKFFFFFFFLNGVNMSDESVDKLMLNLI